MSLGSELSAARKQAGLTLEQVAERTRIRRTLIERIEADDFAPCGGDVYARGHLRTLAKVAGLDPEPLVAEFDRLHAPEPPTAAEVFEADTRVAARDPRGPNWTAAMAAAVVVLLALAAFQVLRGGGNSSATNSPGASTPPAAGASSSSTPTGTTGARSPGPSLVAKLPSSAQGVSVRLTLTGGRSWVSVTTGSRKVYEGVLADGTVKLFNDPRQVKVVIGNAGAVRLVVNGVDLGTAGGNGQVIRLTFTPGDPTGQG